MAPEGGYKNLPDFFSALSEHEIANTVKFVTGTCSKGFGNLVLGDIWKRKIFWQNGMPFIKLGHKILFCQHGKDPHKRRKERMKAAKEEHSYVTKKRFLLHDSKKLGCPAQIIIKETVQFPEFKVTTEGKSVKDKIVKDLRERWMNGEVKEEKLFMVSSLNDHENHQTGKEAESAQPVDKEIIKKIHNMVDEGVRDHHEMRRHIKSFVPHITSSSPAETNRRFYPSDKTIKNHMCLALKKEMSNISDQDNLEEFLNQWQQDNPNDLVVVRLKSENEKLLIVLQTEWQQEMLKKYGETVFLDATYCTSKFSLPLFFLAVKTNDTHQVVAAFLIEDEASSSIREAIEHIKQHNSNWHPKYFVTDLDEREISAMESLFPEASSILCDFHRMQAWHRWLSRSANNVKNKTHCLALLRAMAEELSEEEFQGKVNGFLESSEVAENVKNYFMRTWLPIKEKWAKCYRRIDLSLSNTNNGLERLHQTFKKTHMKGRKMLTLTQMMQILVTSFFKSLKISYIEKNTAWAGEFKTINAEVPEFLQNRPPRFIRHCVEKMQLATNIDKNAAKYEIDLEQPRCSCADFQHTSWPCKHMFAELTHKGTVHWERLPIHYRQSPYLIVDVQAIAGEKQQSATVTGVSEEHVDETSQSRSNNTDHQETSSLKVLQRNVREQLDLLRDKTFVIQDKSLLQTITTKLTAINKEVPASSFIQNKCTDAPIGKRKSLSLRKKKKNRHIFYEEIPIKDSLKVYKHEEELLQDEVLTSEEIPEYQDNDETGDKVRKLWGWPEDCNVPVGKVYGICVTDTDVRSLKGCGWLTDNVIDLKILTVELEEAGTKKVLHLVSSTVGQIMNGSYTTRTPYKLTDYSLVVGAYIRAAHWTLVVLDTKKEAIYFYNPVEGSECQEMDHIKSSMCDFIATCSKENESDVRRRWRVSSLPHSSQSDSFNCGVYCLIFAEKHLSGKFDELTTITKQNLTEARLRIAKKIMEFEVFLTDCCPKCGLVVEEQDEKLQCASCGRSHHFKPYCVEADLKAVKNGDSFCCTLCRFDHWKWPSVTTYSSNNYSWIDKENTLSDLHKYDSKGTAQEDIQLVDPSGDQIKRRTVPRNKPKRKRSSFYYPPIKRQRKTVGTENVYCICRAPYKGRECMWCCDNCNEWFHPKCIGRDDAETPPRSTTAFLCGPCLTNHIKEWTVEGMHEILKHDDVFRLFLEDKDFSEEGFYVRTGDAEKHMRKAFERCWYIVHSEGEKSAVPWLQRHMVYAKFGRINSWSGFGKGLFSEQAIHLLRVNLNKRFLKKHNPKAIYSLHQIIPSMANEKMKKIFEADSGMSEDYINKVLLKEAMVVVLQELTGDEYCQVDMELRKTEARTITKANHLIMNYWNQERDTYMQKHNK